MRGEYGKTLPDFLGIGAQKAGTTWLSDNLRQHPEIWMPLEKEIHYFDRSVSYPSPSFLASDSLLTRIWSKERPRVDWRGKLINTIKKNVGKSTQEPKWKGISWYLKFFFGRCNDDWYASLFERAGDKVKGEITPSYSILEPSDIAHIKEIMPRVKIVFIVRNPIDRVWSSIRYAAWEGGNEKLDTLSPKRFANMVDREGMSLRGDYARTINNWRGLFPEEQFFIGFFDDIVHNPKQLLLSIFEFLGVEPSEEHITHLAFEKANRSPHKEIPPELWLYLAEKYYPQIKTLSEMLGEHANQWRQDTETLLKEANCI